jgi:hypothetical protein
LLFNFEHFLNISGGIPFAKVKPYKKVLKITGIRARENKLLKKVTIPKQQYCGSGSGMGKKSGSGKNNPDHIFESPETIFLSKILKFFDADAESGMEKKFGSGIRDKHPGSATLHC